MRAFRTHSIPWTLLLIALLLIAVQTPLLSRANTTTLDNDEQLANFNSTLIYRVFIKSSPPSFGPQTFLDSLLTIYQSGFGETQFPDVSYLRVRGWCGWPNTSYIATTRYCSTGAGLLDTYDYVFLEYTVTPVGVTIGSSSLAAYAVVSLTSLDVISNNGVPYTVSSSESGALLYNPDNYRDDGYSFTGSTSQSSLAMWIIFAVFLAIFVGSIVGCCCWCKRRNRAWVSKNQKVLRRAFLGFRLGHSNEFDFTRDDADPPATRGDGIGAGRRRRQDFDDVNSTAARYDVYSPEADGHDGSAAGAGRQATSRASEYWPGGSKSAATAGSAYDQEMEERPLGHAERY